MRLLHLFSFYAPKRNFWQFFWNLIFSWKTVFSQWSLMRLHSQAPQIDAIFQILVWSKEGEQETMAFIFLSMEKQSARNLVRAQLHLVMTNPPRLHTIPGKLNTVSGNKDTEMEDFPMGFTCGKILTYIRGAKSCLVWNDAANTPLTSFFLPELVYVAKTTQTVGGFLRQRILGKIASFHEISSMSKAKHLLLRDVPTLPPDKSRWQGWLRSGANFIRGQDIASDFLSP